MEITKKAWCINWDKIDEGAYHAGNIDVVFAESRSKARNKFFKETDICDYKLYKTGEDIEFITIPFCRYKEADKYNINGELLTKYEHEKKKREKERNIKLDEILNNDKITHCYINKGMYYRDNWCGYTDNISEAGVYLKEVAISHSKSVQTINVIPIDTVKHNAMIATHIDKLKTRIIE